MPCVSAFLSSRVGRVLTLAASLSPAGAAWAQTPVVAETPDGGAQDTARLEAFVDGVVAAHRRLRGIPGVSVSVVKDGQLLFAKGYGLAQIEEQRPVKGDRTLFRIGSVSKTFIWTALMMLHEEGRIDLSADVGKYLKEVELPAAFDAPVTVNDLMAHRAGFEDSFAVFTHRDESELSLAAALSRDMPARAMAPGTRTAYSNWGTALAARVVENVSGMPFEKFLFERILKPLKMQRTVLKGPTTMPEALRGDLAAGYTLEAEQPKRSGYMEIGPYAPVGGMASTAADMARWMLVHLGQGKVDGAQLMKPATHRKMWTRAFDDRPDAADMAHGFMSQTYRGYGIVGHGGATAAFLTYMALIPKLGVGIYVSQNASPNFSLPVDVSHLVIDLLIGGEPKRRSWSDEAAEPAEGIKAYAGTYLGNRRAFVYFLKVGAVQSVVEVAPDKNGRLLYAAGPKVRRLHPVPDVPDTYEDDSGFRVFFGRDDEDRVAYVTDVMGTTTFERVGVIDAPSTFIGTLAAAFLLALTILLAAWKRHGRPRQTRMLGTTFDVLDLLAALMTAGFFVALVWFLIALSAFQISDAFNYPPPAVTAFRAAGWAAFGAGLVTVLTIIPGWFAAGWTFWRKLHHTVFALGLGALAFMLVQWKVIFSSLV